MKQIIAVIRDEQVEATKESLAAAGVHGVTFLYVSGRGLQKGRISTRELGESLTRNLRMQLTGTGSADNAPNPPMPSSPDREPAFGFLPKRMLMIMVSDEEVNRIVQAIVNVNQTSRYGDGRIFICPMIGAIRVRTGEQGDKALS
jgi:nitrogen regulatory protein PII 2